MNWCMTFLGEILPSLGTETKTFTLGYSLGNFLRASLQLQDDALSLMTFRYCSLTFPWSIIPCGFHIPYH